MPTHQELPEVFGRYRILKKLGAGGMGAVYLAEDTKLRRKVALKVPHFTAGTRAPGLERFQREARLAAGIDHPNFCPVHDVDEIDGIHFFSMTYIEGTPLSNLIADEQPWPAVQAGELVRRVALAVSELHVRGIVHRDLKPGNVMLRPSGEPVLMDFGLACSLGAESQRLTDSGEVLGTLAYMPPEQLQGDRARFGPAMDVYSLGVVLFELLTGHPPFSATNVGALVHQILHALPPQPSSLRPELEAEIEAICLKALAKNPADRYASMAELATALGEFLARHPEPSPETVVPGVSRGRPADDLLALTRPPTAPTPVGPLPKRFGNSIGMQFVLIPAVTFTMGSPRTEKDRSDDEEQHEVEITKLFYMGTFQVTQAQYSKIMGENPAGFSADGGGMDEVAGMDTSNFPVERVSWDEAVEFCRKLSERPEEKAAGRLYRLPTEAEWEHACRGGAKYSKRFHVGDTLFSSQANFDAIYSEGGAPRRDYLGRTTEVGSYKQPNAFGLHDLHGNVWEWCSDWYVKNYYKQSPRQDPQGPDKGIGRVLRGGSWYDNGWNCRSATRFYNIPGDRTYNIGFRVVCCVPA